VSGGAMGVDALAHKGAGSQNTIGVLANGLDIRYPKINASLLEDIENNGLLLSTYEDKTPSLAWQFVARNEIVVGLSEILIVCEADLNSGSMRSVAFAQNMHKKIYVLPHRMNESLGTHSLVKQNQAKAIHDIDAFIADIGGNIVNHEDTFLDFCKENDNYDEVVKHYADKVFEYELEGKIEVVNGKIIVKV
ncbi:MAG TPA: DNA-processing protein DprA, partial [Helicobacteraceae bacterium]|nr:DNA-processing protein DprA [Helicobacteraceae bacterium]